MRSEIIRRYIKILPSLAIAVVLISIIAWAIVQEPVESQEPNLRQGTQVPLYNPPALST